MHTEEKRIIRPDNPEEGPMDGIQMKVECVRTDFIANPAEGEAPFVRRDKSEAHISASVEIGIFSIRDMESGVMLTVPIQDAVEVMAASMEAAKEARKCTERTLVNAEAVDDA